MGELKLKKGTTGNDEKEQDIKERELMIPLGKYLNKLFGNLNIENLSIFNL